MYKNRGVNDKLTIFGKSPLDNNPKWDYTKIRNGIIVALITKIMVKNMDDAENFDLVAKPERKLIWMLMRAMNHITSCYIESVKKYDMKESELYLMYALADGIPFSQKQIIEEWNIPRTTLNAIVKKWQKSGFVQLTPIPGKRREMTITQTESGKLRTEAYLCKLFRMEENAMKTTLTRYSTEFIEAVQFFEKNLTDNFEKEFGQEDNSIEDSDCKQ